MDTSMLCCWLQVHGKDRCGTTDDPWDHARVAKKIEEEQELNTKFVLPMATVIETGNHIAQAGVRRFETAEKLAEILRSAAQQLTPWIAFDEQVVLWGREGLLKLAEELPVAASMSRSLGDTTIRTVANYYWEGGYTVELFTADADLKSSEPSGPIHFADIGEEEPRRRKDRRRKR
ncbi:hypothetical protein [Tumebacillus flagellatus]|nr:hypothetical protein [Tumebacillus flagellatus]